MKRSPITISSICAIALAATLGCGDGVPPTQAVYLLVDTSGTYTQEIDKVQYGPDLRGLLEAGNSVSGRALAEANAVRDAYAIAFDRLFDDVSAVLTPVIPIPLPANTNLGGSDLSPEQGLLIMRFNLPINMARAPSLTMPCGFTDDGAPVGFQLVARCLHEARLLELGAAYQSATEWHVAHPRVVAS